METARFILTAALAGTVIGPASVSADAPPTPERQAFDLRMDGKSDQARTLLEGALAKDPKDAAAWFELARTEFYHFQFDDAANAIRKAIDLEPDNARYHSFAGLTATCSAISKAHSAQTRDQIEPEMGKALAAYEQAVILDPEFHKARLQLINLLLKTAPGHGGSRAKAIRHVEVLEGKDPIHGVAGRCMLLGENESAKKTELWQQVVAAHPKRADAHAGLARVSLLAGEIELALPEIDEALRLDPSRAVILLTLCREYVSNGDPARAQEAVERYLNGPPPPAPLRAYGTFCLAQLERMQGNDERAEMLMAEARKLDPRCWNTYMEPAEELFEEP